ncbi:MAG: hypothetical protein M3548_14425 [Actinomycetota bacterium]|nr:hypothetical protein [Actinomycetota bacterium]
MTTTIQHPSRVKKKSSHLPPTVRKAMVLLHILSSMTWFGLTLGNLTAAVVGLNTEDARVQHAVYLGAATVGQVLLIPIVLLAFGTGMVLSLATPWGLFRHRWVAVKFWLTLGAALMTLFSLLPLLRTIGATVSATPAGQLVEMTQSQSLLSAACVSGTIYLVCTALSVFKPWGRSKSKLARAVG